MYVFQYSSRDDITIPIAIFIDRRQPRLLDSTAQTLELLKTHDQWSPLIRIDPVAMAVEQNAFFNMLLCNF